MDNRLKNASSDHRAIAFEGIVKDYEYLIREFGIQPLGDLLPRISKPHMYMRRGITFGHVDLARAPVLAHLKAREENAWNIKFHILHGMPGLVNLRLCVWRGRK